MHNSRLLMVLAGFGLLGSALVPRARADEWNKKTKVRFSEPVEIPGKVLPAGKYIFKLMDSQSNRNIVQVFNAGQSRLLATEFAIPDYRLQPTGKTVFKFEERPAGSPPAIKAWFYPGDNYGEEFVYPKTTPTVMAQAVPPPAPPKAAPPCPVQAKQPQAVAPPAPVAPPQPPAQIAQAVKPVPPPAAPKPVKQLPKTASEYPLLMLLGVASLFGAAVLHIVTRRLA